MGFEHTRGQLDVLLQRTNQVEEKLGDYQQHSAKEFARRDADRIREVKAFSLRTSDHELRLRKLEFKLYTMVGVAIALSSLGAHFFSAR